MALVSAMLAGALSAPASAEIYLRTAVSGSTQTGVGVAIGYPANDAAGRTAANTECQALPLGGCRTLGDSNGISDRYVAVYTASRSFGDSPLFYFGSDPDSPEDARATAEQRCSSATGPTLENNRFCSCVVIVNEAEALVQEADGFRFTFPNLTNGKVNPAPCAHSFTNVPPLDCKGDTPIEKDGACVAAESNNDCEVLNENMAVLIVANDPEAIAGDPGAGGCRSPRTNAECRSFNLNSEPIHDIGDTVDGCRFPNSYAECRDFGPTGEIFYDTNHGDNCRVPTSPVECRVYSMAVNNGYTPYFVGGATPSCRAAENSGECPDARPFYSTDSVAAATGNCRVPATHAECANAKSGTGIYHDPSITISGNTYHQCRNPGGNDDCSEIDETTPQENGGACEAATSAAGCPPDRSFYEVDTANPGNCRAPTSNNDCNILNSMMPEVNAGTCRAATSSGGCPDARPRYDPGHDDSIGNCRIRLATDCDDNAPYFDGTMCIKARNAGECPSDESFFDTDASGNCRAPRDNAECDASSDMALPFFGDSGCRAAAERAECPESRPFYHATDSTATGNCREPGSHDDCELLNPDEPLFDFVTGTCGAPKDNNDCIDLEFRIYDENVEGDCRFPNSHEECIDHSDDGNYYDPPATNPGSADHCRQPGSHAECIEVDARFPYNDSTVFDSCRAVDNATECGQISDARMYDENADAAGDCRLRVQDDCTDIAETPFLGSNGVCRPAEKAGECPNAARPVFDDVDAAAMATGNCRERRASDCSELAKPYYDGTECMAASQPDQCPEDILPIYDENDPVNAPGNCRAPRDNGECGDSMNPPIFDPAFLPANGIQCREPNNSGECDRADQATPFYNGTTCVAAGDFAECPTSRPFYHASDSSTTGNCRLPTSTAECGMLPGAGNDLFYDGTQCRAPRDNDECDDISGMTMPELHTDGTCRAATGMPGCPSARPIFNNTDAAAIATGNCRAPETNNDCNALNQNAPQFNNGVCEIADRATGCPAVRPVFDETDSASIGNCRERRDNDCTDPMLPIFADGACRAAREMEECMTTALPIYEAGLTATGNCRLPRDNGECVASENDAIFDNTLSADTIQCRLPEDNAECEIQDTLIPPTDNILRPIYDPADSAAVDNCRVRRANDCTADALPYFNPASSACEVATEESHCPSARPVFEDGLTATGNCRLRESRDCEAANEVFDPQPVGGGECLAPEIFLNMEQVPAVGNVYNAADCEDADWNIGYAIQTTVTSNRGNAAEFCIIPVIRDDTIQSTFVGGAREATTQQFENNGDTANACLTRNSAGLTEADKAGYTPDISGIPNCNIDELFGNEGFPVRPAGFAAPDDLTAPPSAPRLVVAVRQGVENEIYAPDRTTQVMRLVQNAGGGGGSASGNAQDSAKVAGIVGGVLGVVAIVHYFNTGGADAFSFSPDAGYSFTESGYSARFGGRAEYEIGEWDLYWTAGQTNTDGKFGAFRYASGAKFDGEIWNAAFSESVRGETADYDLSLSADLRGNLWSLSPVYRMHSEWKESESGIQTETQNELNLEAEFRYNRWTINPSAGFGWQNFGEFADNGKFRMNAVYRF